MAHDAQASCRMPANAVSALIDAEATEVIAAERYERSQGRSTWRNGRRERLLATKGGDVEVRTSSCPRASLTGRRQTGRQPALRRWIAARPSITSRVLQRHGGSSFGVVAQQGNKNLSRPDVLVTPIERFPECQLKGSFGTWAERY